MEEAEARGLAGISLAPRAECPETHQTRNDALYVVIGPHGAIPSTARHGIDGAMPSKFLFSADATSPRP
jgi:hypothetical protein